MENKIKSLIDRAKESGSIVDVEYQEIPSSKPKSSKRSTEIIEVKAEPVRKRGPIGFFMSNMGFSGNNFKW